MVCKDIDGNEIKAGDTVECVTASQFDALTGVHGRVGRRYTVTRVDGPGSIGLEGLSGSIPTRFRKAPTATRPVYPFKAGDVVVCKDARQPKARAADLTEGKSYTVLRARTSDDRVAYVELLDDAGDPFEYCATRFCAPDEYKAQLSGVSQAAYRAALDGCDAANARADRAERGMVAGVQRVRDLEVQLAGETKAKDKLARANVEHCQTINTLLTQRANLRKALQDLGVV